MKKIKQYRKKKVGIVLSTKNKSGYGGIGTQDLTTLSRRLKEYSQRFA